MSTNTGALYVPVVTPLDANGDCDVAALSRLCQHVLSEGATGIVLFGTLGEGQSFSVAERRAVLDGLLKAGVPADRFIVGTGCTALPDTIELTRHALGSGVARSLFVAPFFFKGVSDAGIEAAFARVFDGVGDNRLRAYLYDIPTVVSVNIAPAVIENLIGRYGSIVAGIKDSVPDWAHVENSIRSFPGLEVFVGNEIFIPQALAIGGAGAISGHGNLATSKMVELCHGGTGHSGKLFEAVKDLASVVGRYPVIPTAKALAAELYGDPAFARVRAPLVPTTGLTPDVRDALRELVNA